jgi:membrane-bound lytic murein transglycosylase
MRYKLSRRQYIGFAIGVSLSMAWVYWPDSPKLSENKTALAPDSLLLQRGTRNAHMVLAPPDSIGPLDFNHYFDSALFQQTLYLVRPSIRERPITGIRKSDLIATVNALQNHAEEITPAFLYEKFDFYRIQTSHKAEKVRITGYYTPVLMVSKKKTTKYSIPLLRRPRNWSGDMPSADQIYAGALTGKGLEIAYCTSVKTLRNAQLQGSCMIQYPDGQQRFLGYGGNNRAIASSTDSTSTLSQPEGRSYVFFQERGENAWGAAGFPLTQGYSVAVDQRVIPFGACLLARIPLRDSTGRTQQVHRIIMSQDMGGAIKSTGHVDLYCGVGEAGLKRVKEINGFAKLWVLLPKKPKD